MSFDALDTRTVLLRRGIELADSLLLACRPPSQFELSEFWFNLDHVQQLGACLHDLRLGPWAVELLQEAERAEEARREAHRSTLRKVGGWGSHNHNFLMADENGHRVALARTLSEIGRALDRVAGQDGSASDKGSGREKGKKLIREARRKLVITYLDEDPSLRDLNYRELSSALAKKGAKVNPSFLSRNLRNTKYDRGRASGKPHHAVRGTNEREAVTLNGPADLPEVDAWTMPDDPS